MSVLRTNGPLVSHFVSYSTFKCAATRENRSLGFPNQVQHEPACIDLEESYTLESLDLGRRGIVLSE